MSEEELKGYDRKENSFDSKIIILKLHINRYYNIILSFRTFKFRKISEIFDKARIIRNSIKRSIFQKGLAGSSNFGNS